MKLPSLFIFDMDGLMFDTERVFMNFLKEVMKEFGYELTEKQYIRTLGLSKNDCVSVMKEMYGEDFPSLTIADITRKRLDDYAGENPMPEKRGIRELLSFLKDRGVCCCVASSSPKKTVEIYLEQAGMSAFFHYIQSGDSLTHSKPDPEVFLRCLEHFGTAAEDAVVLEDSEPGIQAAVNAGIPVICIPDMKLPSEELQSRCHLVAEDADCVREYYEAMHPDCPDCRR